MRIIVIRDQDNQPECNTEFVIPPNMETDEAIKIVDAAVEKVQEKEDYTFEDLLNILTPLGFQSPSFVYANASW